MGSVRTCFIAAGSGTVCVRRWGEGGHCNSVRERGTLRTSAKIATVLVICTSNVAELTFHELPAAAFTFQRSLVLLKYVYSVLSFIQFPFYTWVGRGNFVLQRTHSFLFHVACYE
jgi:hypothetical protein